MNQVLDLYQYSSGDVDSSFFSQKVGKNKELVSLSTSENNRGYFFLKGEFFFLSLLCYRFHSLQVNLGLNIGSLEPGCQKSHQELLLGVYRSKLTTFTVGIGLGTLPAKPCTGYGDDCWGLFSGGGVKKTPLQKIHGRFFEACPNQLVIIFASKTGWLFMGK